MQFNNWHKLQNTNGSSSGDSDQGSSFDPGSPTNIDGLFADGGAPQQYFMNAAGAVSLANGMSTHTGSAGSGANAPTSSPPAPTLVGSANGLQFDLVWDASVASAPKGFVQAVIDAAKLYSNLFSNRAVITIDVGFGEIGGAQLAPTDIGESESFLYLVDYPTVTGALSAGGFRFSAANEPTTNPMLITSADAKAMGLVDPVAGLDGFIGFGRLSGTGFSWNTGNGGIKANQFDLEAAVEHEISEVMGRLGLEGLITINGQPAYTPLDLFNYQSPGVLALSPNGGYFSIDNGRIALGSFNNAAVNGGDIGDWASGNSLRQSNTLGLLPGSYDAYDAFALPGFNGQVSLSDVIEDAALGYTLKPTAAAALLANLAAGFGGQGALTGAGGQAAQEAIQQHPLANPHG
jgi:hypothetical protein